jgi:hypothetical protein
VGAPRRPDVVSSGAVPPGLKFSIPVWMWIQSGSSPLSKLRLTKEATQTRTPFSRLNSERSFEVSASADHDPTVGVPALVESFAASRTAP